MSATLADDCVVVVTPRRWGAAALLLAGAALWAGLWALLGPGTVAGVLLLTVGVIGVPAAAVGAKRALATQRHVVARGPGRLVLDGDPIELARIELRMVAWPLTQRPRRYALSLWMMTSTGPVDLPLGDFRTLFEASAAAGAFEDFVKRANLRQAGATRAR